MWVKCFWLLGLLPFHPVLWLFLSPHPLLPLLSFLDLSIPFIFPIFPSGLFFSSFFFLLWPPAPLLLSVSVSAHSPEQYFLVKVTVSTHQLRLSKPITTAETQNKHVFIVRWVVLKHTPNWAQFGIVSCLDSSGLKTHHWVSKGKIVLESSRVWLQRWFSGFKLDSF